MSKPREFYIQDSGEEVYTATEVFCYDEEVNPSIIDEWRVIEYSAYQALERKLEVAEQDILKLIDERDVRENQVSEIADILGDTSEWSNISDRGENAIERAHMVMTTLELAKSALEAARSEICTLEGPLGLALNPVQKQIEQALAEIKGE